MVMEKIKEFLGIGTGKIAEIGADKILSDLEKLKLIRSGLANVYESQAADELHDNGNLSEIHVAILAVENAILCLQTREAAALLKPI